MPKGGPGHANALTIHIKNGAKALGKQISHKVDHLRGFEKVALAGGETKRVSFAVPVGGLAYYDVGAKAWVVERQPHSLSVGGSLRAADLLTATFQVVD